MAYQTYPYPGFQPFYPQPVQDVMAQYRQPGVSTIAPPVQPVQPAVAQPPSAPAAASDERIWVQGEVAAASWPVTANGFVRLWDSTAPVFYEKRADAQGKPLPLEVYDYKRRGGEIPVMTTPQNYEDRIKAIEDRLSAVEGNQSAGKEKEDAK